MSEVYHYSPELLQLLVDTIEVLCRSKRDVILFFRGAGVHGQVIVNPRILWEQFV